MRDLSMIGLDRVAGYWTSSVLQEWRSAGGAIETMPRVSVDELRARMGADEIAVLDVRGRAEWEAGHLPGVANIPVGYLDERLDEIPRDVPVAVHCQSGGRSAIAASLLRARGFTNVLDVTGGFSAWQAAGGAVESETALAERA